MMALSFRRLLVLTLAFITATNAAGPTPTSKEPEEPVIGLRPRTDNGGGDHGGGPNGGANGGGIYNNGEGGWGLGNGGGNNGGGGGNNGGGWGNNGGGGGHGGGWGNNEGNGGGSSPSPSQHPRPRATRRMTLLSPFELADSICPSDLSGCPIAEAGTLSALPTSVSAWTEQGFECVDLKADLRACGGCPSLDGKHDCTLIEGADDIACVAGQCVVGTCHSGYTLDSTTHTCNRK